MEKYFKKKILIVDDSSTMRILVKRFLEIHGYTSLSEANDGDVALNMIKESSSSEPYDLVLLDWNMPIMTGFQLLKNLRASDDVNLKNILIVMVTCEVNRSQVELAFSNGANNYIAKPFKKSILTEKILSTFIKALEKEEN